MGRSGYRTTAEQASEGIDLGGQEALVTGANTGLGKETARVLALRGARVLMACRDLEKAASAREEILAAHPVEIDEGQLELHELDLNSLAAVRESAAAFNALERPLHILVNNAGIMIPMERRTEDGFEAHLGINHLAHFLFTRLILDRMLEAGQSRAVILSSAAAAMAGMTPELADLNWEQRKFKGWPAYGDSKLMNHMFARELQRRYGDQGLCANALHPGVIATELARDQNKLGMLLGIVALPFMKSIPQGAATSVFVATAPDYADTGGLFFKDCGESKPPHKLANNDEVCAKVWALSEELVGL